MTKPRDPRQRGRDATNDRPDPARRHATGCQECHSGAAADPRFEIELASAAARLSSPSLPPSTLAAAEATSAQRPSVIRFVSLGAAVTAVLVLAVVTGMALGWLVDRDPTNVGVPSQSPEPTSPYRHSRQEFLMLVGDCVRDEGFPSVRVDVRESKIDFADPSDVRAGGPDAVRACVVRVDPARHEPPPPRSERQLLELYDFRVAQARCLVARGYYVEDPPSLDEFLADDAEWEPNASTSAPTDVRTQCDYVPQRPDFFDW